MRDQNAIWQPSPYFFLAREGHAVERVVIHKTGGGSSAPGIASWFQDARSQVSTNYVIGPDGTIICCCDECNGAWANGALTEGHDPMWDTLAGVNPNDVTVSIEFVDPATDNSSPLTDAQKAVGFPLIKRICQRWHLPMDDRHIVGHNSLDPVNRRDCPGNFPWEDLWAYSKQEDTLQITLDVPAVKGFFVAAPGGAWHCPSTGCTVGGAILAFYQKFGNSGDCGLTHLGLPKSNEQGVQGHAGVVEQVFERATLRYDPGHVCDNPPGAGSVYLVHQKGV